MNISVKVGSGYLLTAALGFALARYFKRLTGAPRSPVTIGQNERAIESKGEHNKELFPQYIVNADGLWLFTRSWTVAKPKAIVFLCHGLGEHIGRYERLAAKLNQQGYSVYGMDHMGHGQSWGYRAFCERFAHFVRDYIQFVRHVQSSFNKPLPCFIFGHSMGGLIATQVIRACHAADSRSAASASASASASSSSASPSSPSSPSTIIVPGSYLSNSASASSSSAGSPPGASLARDNLGCWPWSGMMLSSPALHVEVNPIAALFASVLSYWTPQLPVTKLDLSNLSVDPNTRYQYHNDPLVYHGAVKARLGAEMLKTIKEVQANASSFSCPFFIVHGRADTICKAQGSKDFCARASGGQLFEYEGGFHEMLLDNNRDQVTRDLLSFIQRRVKEVKPSSSSSGLSINLDSVGSKIDKAANFLGL